MSSRNRHLKYRKSIYKKRRVRSAIIISVSAAVIAFVIFMVLGTMLHSKTQPDSDATSNSDPITNENKNTNTLHKAPTVNAYSLPLLMNGSLFSERLNDIDSDASDVCISLNDSYGTLLYKSEIAESFSNIDVAEYAGSLGNSLTAISRKDLYTTAILYIPSLDNNNDLEKEIELTIWGAIACEALLEGVGDILIIAPEATPDDIDDLTDIADMIHDNVPESVVGFTLSDAFVVDEDKIEYIDMLKSHFNYLAVDMATSEDKQNIEYIEDLKMQSMIIRHQMRILLPYSADENIQNEYIKSINQSNFMNWQILPPQ